MSIKNIFITIFVLPLMWGMAFSSSEVSFEFDNIEKVSGRIYLAVIDDPEVWEDDVAGAIIPFQAIVAVGEKDVRIKVEGLKPGKYAAKIFQDLNGNGKLDTNALKIPKEPYGFSLNQKGLFGIPKFKDVSFTVKEKDLVFKIKFF